MDALAPVSLMDVDLRKALQAVHVQRLFDPGRGQNFQMTLFRLGYLPAGFINFCHTVKDDYQIPCNEPGHAFRIACGAAGANKRCASR